MSLHLGTRAKVLVETTSKEMVLQRCPFGLRKNQIEELLRLIDRNHIERLGGARKQLESEATREYNYITEYKPRLESILEGINRILERNLPLKKIIKS